MAIALTRIEVAAHEGNQTIEAKLWPGELKRLIGDPTNIYKTLKKISKTMTGHTMFIEDGRGNFKAFAVVNNAEYVDGVFTVEFNKNLREHIIGLEKNYTSFELAVLTRFKRNSSFRLYELLKSNIYRSRKEVNGGRVDVEFNISELRFMIGLANGDDPGVKNAMAAMGGRVDWDELYNKLDKKDRKYESWFDFQRYVVKPAQEELEEKSNIRFDYEGVREGRKMGRIRFFVYPNIPTNPDVLDERKEFIEKNSIQERQLELPRDMDKAVELYDDFVGHNELSQEDIDVLLKTAKFDVDLVRRCIEYADKQPNIENYMGFLVASIKEGGYEEVPVMNGSHETAVVINKFNERVNSPETKKKIWEITKNKDDFPEFLNYMKDTNGISLDELELCYEPAEAIQEYIRWKQSGSPTGSGSFTYNF